MGEFDYVIVGGGSAGCVLAARLSEDPNVRVLLVEAGGSGWGWRISMPAALAYPMQNPAWNWNYRTEPQRHMDNRSIHWPRGRIVGGSSSINGMVYVRGHALDYERWVDQGARGWGWADVLPYFKKAENFAEGGDTYRGDDGPLHSRRADAANPLCKAWLAAGGEAGYAESQDLNGFRQEGVGRLDMTVHGGRRWSADRAYLAPARKRPNLKVLKKSLVLNIAFEGIRAIGIRVARGRTVSFVRASREVIVCGGAINSPQLLQLSGVGPARLLSQLRIPVIADRADVGSNLQDHLCVYIQHKCLTNDSLAEALKPLRKAGIGLRWLTTRSGLGASNHFEVGGFIRTNAGVQHPDLQYHFMPIAIGYEDRSETLAPSYQVDADIMRPESRGNVLIRSSDPTAHPTIDPNYLEAEADRIFFRDAVCLTREIFAQPAFREFRGAEILPGADLKSDAQIDGYVRTTAESAYHPSCTCRMGTDNDAVVDPACKVVGVEGLRVVDASVMPSVVSGNLNAPTIMIAEKAADIIKGKASESPQNAPYFVSPAWAKTQR